MKAREKIATMKISKKVQKAAKHFGIDFRVGADPKKLKIMGVSKAIRRFPAAYFGDGVVWVNEPEARKFKNNIDIILLHEIGHAILDFFPLGKLHWKDEENMANAIALALAAQYRIPVHVSAPKNFGRLARSKGKARFTWKGEP